MGEIELRAEVAESRARLAVLKGGRPERFGDDRHAVIGCNHDIVYKGRVFHVQSEDSGRHKRHIFTHVFHEGVILASSKADYGPDIDDACVIELLRESHKAMLRTLVRGGLDEVVARLPRPSRAQGAPSGETPVPDAVACDEDPSARARERIARLREDMGMDDIGTIIETVRSGVAGSLGVALVDYESGMCLGSAGAGIDIDVAAAGNAEVMKSKSRVMRELGIEGGIEDILITLESQYHIIRPVGAALFLYLAIDRTQGNLALARHKLAIAAQALEA